MPAPSSRVMNGVAMPSEQTAMTRLTG